MTPYPIQYEVMPICQTTMDRADPFLPLQLEIPLSKSTSTLCPISILPFEILLLILSRLPLTSRIRSKYVCRSWRSLVEDNLESFSQKSSTLRQEDPCVLLHCDYPLRNSLCFVDLSDEERSWKVRKLRVPFDDSVPEFEVVGSCHRLFCAMDSLHGDRVVVWDVFGRDFWELPTMGMGSQGLSNEDVVFGFGRDSVSGEWKVVKVFRKRVRMAGCNGILPVKSEVHVCTLGSDTWRKLSDDGPHLLLGNSSQPLVNGRIHWATIPCLRNRESRIVSFDLSSEQFRIVSQPDCLDFRRSYFTLFLMDGCITTANVTFIRGALDIWVLKVYDMAESWIKEYSIGPHVPRNLKDKEIDLVFKMSRIFWRGRYKRMHIRALCILSSGKLLLECHSKGLVSYEPKCDKAVPFSLPGLPKWFDSVVSWGS